MGKAVDTRTSIVGCRFGELGRYEDRAVNGHWKTAMSASYHDTDDNELGECLKGSTERVVGLCIISTHELNNQTKLSQLATPN